MRRPAARLDPRYPLQGFTILAPGPYDWATETVVAEVVEIGEVEAWRTNVLTGESERLGPDDPFVKVFDSVDLATYSFHGNAPHLHRIK